MRGHLLPGDLLSYGHPHDPEYAIGLCLVVTASLHSTSSHVRKIMKVLWFDDWKQTEECLEYDREYIRIVSPGSSVG